MNWGPLYCLYNSTLYFFRWTINYYYYHLLYITSSSIDTKLIEWYIADKRIFTFVIILFYKRRLSSPFFCSLDRSPSNKKKLSLEKNYEKGRM